jgi:hypothetical protein
MCLNSLNIVYVVLNGLHNLRLLMIP